MEARAAFDAEATALAEIDRAMYQVDQRRSDKAYYDYQHQQVRNGLQGRQREEVECDVMSEDRVGFSELDLMAEPQVCLPGSPACHSREQPDRQRDQRRETRRQRRKIGRGYFLTLDHEVPR